MALFGCLFYCLVSFHVWFAHIMILTSCQMAAGYLNTNDIINIWSGDSATLVCCASLFMPSTSLFDIQFSSASVFSCMSQEVLVWLTALQKELGGEVSDEKMRDYIWNTLKSGRVKPHHSAPPTLDVTI